MTIGEAVTTSEVLHFPQTACLSELIATRFFALQFWQMMICLSIFLYRSITDYQNLFPKDRNVHLDFLALGKV